MENQLEFEMPIATLARFHANRKGLFPSHSFGKADIFLADSIGWLKARPGNSVHAVVTDPPYGFVEYTDKELSKLRNGKGGVWRVPPKLDGCERKPLPRFTVLDAEDKLAMRSFFRQLASELYRVLVPGGHIFIASNPIVSYLVYEPLVLSGFEKRGEIIRVVQTLRGGDRPKNAHEEFPQVSVMPRSCWEPWGLFRKPCEGRVQDNLRKWKTGGLRRISESEPFRDLIHASPARGKEVELADHPSLKPQKLLRQLVKAALPMGEGVILDPFMGSGSTVAACLAMGLRSIGVEVQSDYYGMAKKAIPELSRLTIGGES